MNQRPFSDSGSHRCEKKKILITVSAAAFLLPLLVHSAATAELYQDTSDGTSSHTSDSHEDTETTVSHDHDSESSFRGLGDYGPVGPIQRTDLPRDLPERITEEALDVAQSDALAEARASWDEDSDFVHQVQYQLKMRADVDYLDDDVAHIGYVLEERPRHNSGWQALRLFLLETEADEFDRRTKLGTRIPQVASLAGRTSLDAEGRDHQYSDNFGGIWIDQMNEGRITVALVDPTKVNEHELATHAGGMENLNIVKVDYSYVEMRDFRQSLYKELDTWGLQASIAINPTPAGERLELMTPDPNAMTEEILSVVPSELVEVVAGELPVEEGAPNTTHSESDQQPGLRVNFDPGAGCTWGANGHTSSNNYLVTAGHCGELENFIGFTGDEEILQNDSFLLTPGIHFSYSINSNGFDMKRASSAQADSNCYHAVLECFRFIQSRAYHNSWEVDSDMVCASLGRTNAYECGFVLEINFDEGVGGCTGDRYVRYDIDTSPGDSGAGLMFPIRNADGSNGPGATIDAIHSCGRGETGYGNTAYDVKTELEFDFNCAPCRNHRTRSTRLERLSCRSTIMSRQYD